MLITLEKDINTLFKTLIKYFTLLNFPFISINTIHYKYLLDIFVLDTLRSSGGLASSYLWSSLFAILIYL